MNANAILSGTEGIAYIILPDNRRKVLANLVSMSASLKYTKKSFGLMGSRQKAVKPGPAENSGKIKMYFNTSTFRELALEYKNTGRAPKYDLQIVNNDAASTLGPQVVLLYGFSFDEQMLFNLDIDDDALTEETGFTFDDWDLENVFGEGGLLDA